MRTFFLISGCLMILSSSCIRMHMEVCKKKSLIAYFVAVYVSTLVQRADSEVVGPLSCNDDSAWQGDRNFTGPTGLCTHIHTHAQHTHSLTHTNTNSQTHSRTFDFVRVCVCVCVCVCQQIRMRCSTRRCLKHLRSYHSTRKNFYDAQESQLRFPSQRSRKTGNRHLLPQMVSTLNVYTASVEGVAIALFPTS
jgi:hypothetical protein